MPHSLYAAFALCRIRSKTHSLYTVFTGGHQVQSHRQGPHRQAPSLARSVQPSVSARQGSPPAPSASAPSPRSRAPSFPLSSFPLSLFSSVPLPLSPPLLLSLTRTPHTRVSVHICTYTQVRALTLVRLLAARIPHPFSVCVCVCTRGCVWCLCVWCLCGVYGRGRQKQICAALVEPELVQAHILKSQCSRPFLLFPF